ncbi:MAG: hypothetical protein KA275_04685 [Chitinophagaceae bacterium]|nr:hypothetical protein [Chitinophagaceae bacterium]
MFQNKIVAQQKNNQQKNYTISNIVFNGNKVTKPFLLLREMNVGIGDRIEEKEINEVLETNKARLLNLQLFSNVDAKYSLQTDSNIELIFNVNEIFYWVGYPIFSLADRNFNTWWMEQNHRLDRTNIGINVNRINFRGRNETIGIEAQAGYNKHLLLYYKIPYIDKKLRQGLRMEMAFNTGREIQNETKNNKQFFFTDTKIYPYQNYKIEAAWTYRPAYALTHEIVLGFNDWKISKKLFQETPHFLGGTQSLSYFELRYKINYNKTDSRIYPFNGINVTSIIAQKGLSKNKEMNQFSITSDLNFYKSFFRNNSFSFQIRSRYSVPDVQPYFNYRALGFKNEYVRGYEFYVIDGSHYFIGRTSIRQKLFESVLENTLMSKFNRFPVSLIAKTYYDFGKVYAQFPQNNTLSNTFLQGYGVGLDVVLSYYAVFRIEYSLNHLNQKGLFLHGRKE